VQTIAQLLLTGKVSNLAAAEERAGRSRVLGSRSGAVSLAEAIVVAALDGDCSLHGLEGSSDSH